MNRQKPLRLTDKVQYETKTGKRVLVSYKRWCALTGTDPRKLGLPYPQSELADTWGLSELKTA